MPPFPPSNIGDGSTVPPLPAPPGLLGPRPLPVGPAVPIGEPPLSSNGPAADPGLLRTGSPDDPAAQPLPPPAAEDLPVLREIDLPPLPKD